MNLVLKIQRCWMKRFTLRCFLARSPRVHLVTRSIPRGLGHMSPTALHVCADCGPPPSVSPHRHQEGWGLIQPVSPAHATPPPSLGDRAEEGNCLLGKLPQSVVSEDPPPHPPGSFQVTDEAVRSPSPAVCSLPNLLQRSSMLMCVSPRRSPEMNSLTLGS